MPLPTINQRTSRRTRVLKRRVADPGKHVNPAAAGVGFGAFAKAFDTWAGKLSVEEEKQEVLKDQEALARLALDINSRPEEAAEAVRSGDYSKFVDANRQGRVNFITQAPQVVANHLGYTSALEFNKTLNDMPLGADPVAAAQEYAQSKIKGMPATAGLAFTEAFQKATSKALSERQTNMEKLAVARMKGRMVDTLETAAGAGALQNIQDVYKIVWSSATAAGGNNVANMLELQTISDEFVARMSAHEDRNISDRFNAMLHENDTNRGGSVADRLGSKKVASLKADQLKSYQKSMTIRGSQAIAQAENRLSEWKAGRAGPGVNPSSILDALDSIMEAEGIKKTNEEYGGIYRKVLGEFEDGVLGQGALNTPQYIVRRGMTKKEINAGIKEAKRAGVDPIAHPKVIEFIAFNNTPGEMKSRFNNAMMTGNADEFALARRAIKSAMEIGKRGIENYITDKKAMAIFLATENASPQEALQIRAMLGDILQARGPKGFDGAFWELAQRDGIDGFSRDTGKSSQAFTEKKAAKFLFADEQLLKQMGMHGASLDRMDGVLRTVHIPAILNVATLAAMATGNTSMDAIRKHALSMLRDDLEAGVMGSDGVIRASKREAPYFVGQGKEATPSSSITLEMGEKFAKIVDDADATGKIGYATDALTREDGTVQLYADNGGGLQPFMFSANQRIEVDPLFVGKLGLNNLFVTDEAPLTLGKVVIRPKIPGPDDPKSYKVDAVTTVVYDEVARAWSVRRALGPDYEAIQRGETKAAVEALGVTRGDVDQAVDELNEEAARTIGDLRNKAAESLANNPWVGRSEEELVKFQKDITEQLPSTKHDKRKMLLAQRAQVTEALEDLRVKREAEKQQALSTKALAELIETGDPRTLSAEQIRAELAEIQTKTRDEIGPGGIEELATRARRLQAALEQRAAGVPPLSLDSLLPDNAVPGTGLAVDEMTAVGKGRYNQDRREAINKSIQEGVTRGTYHPAAIAAARDASSLEEARKLAEQASLRNGHNKDTVMPDAPNTNFMSDVVDEVTNQATLKPTPVEKNGGTVIGYDFDITREDAEELMEAAGLFKDTIDQEPVTPEQAKALAQVTVAKQEQYLRDEFKGFPLRKNEKRALHSYMASRNEAKLPKTVTDNIKRGNTAAAARFIQASPSFKVLDTMENTEWAEAVPKSVQGIVVDMTGEMIAKGQTQYGEIATATRQPMEYVVFHDTGAPTLQSAFNSMNVFDPGRGFNPGYHAIAAGGKVYLVTPPNKRPNATKRPVVPGQKNNNSFQLAFQDKSPETMAAVAKFSQEVLVNKLGIHPASFGAHGTASNRGNQEGVREVLKVQRQLTPPPSDGANAHRRTKEALILKGTDRFQ